MMNINLLPKKSTFSSLISTVITGLLVLSMVVSLGSYLIYLNRIQVEEETQTQLLALERKEAEATKKLEEMQYVYKLEQLQGEAEQLELIQIDWIRLLDTVYAGLPTGGEIESLGLNQDEMGLQVFAPTREMAAQYLAGLRNSELFVDGFISEISDAGGVVGAPTKVKFSITLKLNPTFLAGGTK